MAVPDEGEGPRTTVIVSRGLKQTTAPPIPTRAEAGGITGPGPWPT
jgi:hypothetical protein